MSAGMHGLVAQFGLEHPSYKALAALRQELLYAGVEAEGRGFKTLSLSYRSLQSLRTSSAAADSDFLRKAKVHPKNM